MQYFTPLAGGRAAAAAILFRMRRNRNTVQSIAYKGNQVRFRGCDEQVLKEVLVDKEYSFLRNWLSTTPSPRILDVGAHVGTFSIWAFSVNPKARILSVEANPDTYQLAEQNAETLSRKGFDWNVLQYAVWSEDDTMLRFTNTGPTMSHRIDTDGLIQVPSISLATLMYKAVPEGKSIDLAKIDIEGSEEAFLCSDPEALKNIDSLVIELHPQLCDVRRVRKLLKASYDSIKEIDGRVSTKPLWYCRRKKA